MNKLEFNNSLIEKADLIKVEIQKTSNLETCGLIKP